MTRRMEEREKFGSFLEQNGLEDFLGDLFQNGFDTMRLFSTINKEDLIEMNFTLGEQKSILGIVELAKQQLREPISTSKGRTSTLPPPKPARNPAHCKSCHLQQPGHKSTACTTPCPGLQYCNYELGHKKEQTQKRQREKQLQQDEKRRKKEEETQLKKDLGKIKKEIFKVEGIPGQTEYTTRRIPEILKEKQKDFDQQKLSTDARRSIAIREANLEWMTMSKAQREKQLSLNQIKKNEKQATQLVHSAYLDMKRLENYNTEDSDDNTEVDDDDDILKEVFPKSTTTTTTTSLSHSSSVSRMAMHNILHQVSPPSNSGIFIYIMIIFALCIITNHIITSYIFTLYYLHSLVPFYL